MLSSIVSAGSWNILTDFSPPPWVEIKYIHVNLDVETSEQNTDYWWDTSEKLLMCVLMIFNDFNFLLY